MRMGYRKRMGAAALAAFGLLAAQPALAQRCIARFRRVNGSDFHLFLGGRGSRHLHHTGEDAGHRDVVLLLTGRPGVGEKLRDEAVELANFVVESVNSRLLR